VIPRHGDRTGATSTGRRDGPIDVMDVWDAEYHYNPFLDHTVMPAM
jgi:hypothetical protein